MSVGNGSNDNRIKEKHLKKPTRFRSQSSGSVDSPASGVAVVSNKISTLDRPRAENLSNVDVTSPSGVEKGSTRRNLEKPPKKIAPVIYSNVNSPEVTKHVVPPLASTPELVRSNGKGAKGKNSSKRFVSRSLNDGSIGGDLVGPLKTHTVISTIHATPPRHVGNLKDDLAHIPSHLSSSNDHATITHTTPVKDLSNPLQASKREKLVNGRLKVGSGGSNSRNSSPAAIRSTSGKQKGLQGGNSSRNSSPSPVDSIRSSRSNSGSSGTHLELSPLTITGNGESIDVHVSSGMPSITNKSSGSTNISTNSGGNIDSKKNSDSTNNAVAGSDNVIGNNNPFRKKSNPFTSFNSTRGDLDNSNPPKDSKNIFERRLQEAQALNRKEYVNGAVMHEFSLWKNFSADNASKAAASECAKEKEHHVAPPKKTTRSRFLDRSSSDEAIEQNDKDIINNEKSRDGSNKRGVSKKINSENGPTSNSGKPKSPQPIVSGSISRSNEPTNSFDQDCGQKESSDQIAITSSKNKRAKKQFKNQQCSRDENDVHEIRESVNSTSRPLTPEVNSQQTMVASLLVQPNKSDVEALQGRGHARNFRSMVGSCKKTLSTASSDVDLDTLLSEQSVDLTDPFSLRKSLSGSVESIESSTRSSLNCDQIDDESELAILGIAHEPGDNVDLSFVSEDDNCILHQSLDDTNISSGLRVERTLNLHRAEDESLEESVDVNELDEEVDSLLLSNSQSISHEPVDFNSQQHPFSPRACDIEEDVVLSHQPPALAKKKTKQDTTFYFSSVDETSVDHSAEIVQTNVLFDHLHITESAVPHLEPLQMHDSGLPLGLYNKNAHLCGDFKIPEVHSGRKSEPNSSRLPTERTTDKHTKYGNKILSDNVSVNTCVMSASLGNPPPLVKANLQAKQSMRRSGVCDKAMSDSKKIKKQKKSRGKKNCDMSLDHNGKDDFPLQGSEPNVYQQLLPAVGTEMQHRDLNEEVDERKDNICDENSISSELSEMSESSSDFDHDNPFPMTEAEKGEMELQQQRKHLEMAGLGHLARFGALTAPGALESKDNSVCGSHNAQKVEHDQVFRIDNDIQWKKGNDMLGQGSFGQVYKGMNCDTGELLAVKQICLCDGAEDEVASLRKEIDVMKDLDHPNIVRLVDHQFSWSLGVL